VIRGIHPVGVHGAQVLDLELDERSRKVGLVSQTVGEGVGLELVAAAEDVHEQLDDGFGGGQDVRKEEEADDDGALEGEAEGGVEGGVVDEDGEEREDVDEVDLDI